MQYCETIRGYSERDGNYQDSYRFAGLRPHPDGPISKQAFDQLYDLAVEIDDAVGITSERQNVHAYSDARGNEPAISIRHKTLGRKAHKAVWFSIEGGGVSTNYSIRNDCGIRLSSPRGPLPMICGEYSIHEKDSVIPRVLDARLSEKALLRLYPIIAFRARERRFRQEPDVLHIYNSTKASSATAA